VTQLLVPNHVICFDTKKGSEPATFIQGGRIQFDGIKPIFTGAVEQHSSCQVVLHSEINVSESKPTFIIFAEFVNR
jgi:hypothetical protein